MPDKITDVLVINYFDRVSKDSESGGERPSGMHETLCKFLFHCHKYHDTAKPFDPEKAWADHLNRLADIDRLYPSKSPLLARHISPPLSTKRLFDIHGNLVTDYDYLPSFPSLLRKKPLFDLLEPSPMAPISAFTRDPWWYPSFAPYIPNYAARATPFYLRDSYLSPVKRSYLWSRHPIRPFGDLYYYYSKPVPRFHFTSPWYNKRTTH